MSDASTPIVPSSEGNGAVDPASGTPAPLRVLVVDDEPSMCRAMTLGLAWYGLQAVAVPSAAAALASLAEQHFDVLLVDFRLRDARGDALFQMAAERHPHLRGRTLFMTGDISTEAERAIAATNCPYLRKPFDMTVAVQAIFARAERSIAREPGPELGEAHEERSNDRP
jgi:DNA-binding NtrC family response regulator